MSEQKSDSAQKGPGLKPPSTPASESAPSPSPSGQNPSGSSQSSSRGPQG
jgi:hypothetical protein